MRRRAARRAAAVVALGALGASATISWTGCNLILDISPGNPLLAGEIDGSATDALVTADQDTPILPDGGCADDRVACSGVCVDIKSSSAHCGRCGHDCVGGTCTAGTCDPVAVAAGLGVPRGIALDSDLVYVTLFGANEVVSIDKKSGVLQTLVPGTKTRSPGQLRINTTGDAGAQLIWGESPTVGNAEIHTCQLPSCATVLDRSNASEQRYVTVRDGVAYFTQFFLGAMPGESVMEVRKCTVASCTNPQRIVAVGQHVLSGIAVNGTDLIYGYKANEAAATSGLRKTTINGGNPTTFASNIAEPAGLATDGTFVFAALTKGNAILKCPMAGCPTPPETVFAASPREVATDGTNVYWTSGLPNGTIGYCPVANCTAATTKTLARDQFEPWGIALDDAAVYWTNAIANGQVMRVAKP